MLADFFTKPLQGEKFRTLRAYIMGWDGFRCQNYLFRRLIKRTNRIKEDVGKRDEKL